MSLLPDPRPPNALITLFKPRRKRASKPRARKLRDTANSVVHAVVNAATSRSPRPLTKRGRANQLESRIAVRELVTTVLLTIPALATTMLTYFGASVPLVEQGGGIVPKAEALLFSISVGSLVFLGTYFAFGILPLLRGVRLAVAATAIASYTLIVAAIDAPFNLQALAGAPAVQMSLVDTATSYERYRDPIFQRVASSQKLALAIRPQAARFTSASTHELAGRGGTGQAGVGLVSTTLGLLGQQLDDLAKQLDANVAAAQALQADITAAISEMKSEAHAQRPIRDRVMRTSQAADRADDLLARLAMLDAAAGIRATLETLVSSVAMRPATTPAQTQQNNEIARIAAMVVPLRDALTAALNETTAASAPTLERRRPLEASEAIVTYWRRLIPQIVAAIFPSIAPLLLLVVLFAARREAEHAAKRTAPKGQRQ